MLTPATIGLDIAKNVFQVHGIGSDGKVYFRQQLKRSRVLAFFKKLKPCVVGVEACATSHHWTRESGALGHTVKLMPPAYVRPYVKRQKNDAADAEAICEAVQRPSMRFVPVKSPDEQAGMVLHRTRHLFVRHLTAVVNALRALAVIRNAQKHGTTHRPWLTRLLERRPAKVAAIALASKLARMAWAIMSKGETYREPAALAREQHHPRRTNARQHLANGSAMRSKTALAMA